jgi:hypothetical protein
MNSDISIPGGLKTWFLIHFAVDMVFAIPLIFFPELFLAWIGWQPTDPVMPRLVGAALLGIGGESLFSRHASRDTFKALLRLKIIWASGAILALLLGIFRGGPALAWAFVGIFGIFLLIWIYYLSKLK